MPLGEIAIELTGAVVRVIGHILIDVVLDVAVKGLGYLVCKFFSKSPEPDGVIVILVGVATWLVIFALVFIAYQTINL